MKPTCNCPARCRLSLRRNYSSQNLADNQFGTGWKFSIMPYLSVGTGGTNIYAADMDGAVLAYVRTTHQYQCMAADAGRQSAVEQQHHRRSRAVWPTGCATGWCKASTAPPPITPSTAPTAAPALSR